MRLTPEEIAAHHQDMVRQLEEAKERSERTTALFGLEGRDRMASLGLRFPTLKNADGVNPWNPERLVRWLYLSGAPTGGSTHAAKFLLTVWNSSEDWGLYAREIGIPEATWAPFNVVRAMGVWDEEHQAAFRLWCTYPFWP